MSVSLQNSRNHVESFRASLTLSKPFLSTVFEYRFCALKDTSRSLLFQNCRGLMCMCVDPRNRPVAPLMSPPPPRYINHLLALFPSSISQPCAMFPKSTGLLVHVFGPKKEMIVVHVSTYLQSQSSTSFFFCLTQRSSSSENIQAFHNMFVVL
jgi:hypothetical protein